VRKRAKTHVKIWATVSVRSLSKIHIHIYVLSI